MADYQKMYFTLFNEVSKVIQMLQNAQCKAEEVYSSADDTVLKIVKEQEEKKSRLPKKQI